MKTNLLSLVLMFTVATAFSADRDLAVSGIPEKLKENANAVVRYEENLLESDTDGSAVMVCRYAITVMNENGKMEGYFIRNYNKFMKYKRISGVIYDKDGKKIRKLKSSEIRDVSNIASYSLYEDTRAKVALPKSNRYPYTVVYEYSLVLKSVLSFPAWSIVPGYDVSVQYSDYTVKMPRGKRLKYYPVGIDLEPEISSGKDYDIYHWKVENLTAIREESYSRNIREYFPSIYLNPLEFNYGGVSGKGESWDEYGKWIWKLVEDKQDFTPETEAEIRNVYQNCNTNREIVERLYKYMQGKVRYVNISIGLGGLEPIPAQRVHDVSYGDCKALSNYMAALLKVAGIKSLYSAVNAGANAKRVHTEHPSISQFNHVILMVPLEQDSIWLECTSQRLPPGYLGTFTDDRVVLFISEEGGALGRTPEFSMDENCVTTHAEVVINNDLSADIVREKCYEGLHFEDKYNEVLYLDKEEQKRQIQKSIDLSGFKVRTFTSEVTAAAPVQVKQRVEIEDDLFLTRSGDYIMLKPSLISSPVSLPTRVRDRRQELYLRRASMAIDTIAYRIPEGIVVEQVPEPSLISSEYGIYRSEVRHTGNQLLYIRNMQFGKGYFPAENYSEFYSYYREIIRANDQEVVLRIL